jgi:SAM-dependent methyltransferase
MAQVGADFDAELYALRAREGLSPDDLRRQHERTFPWYETFLRPWLPADQTSRMLDVPCGAGNLLFALHRLGYTAAAGVDSEPRQVALAQQLGLPAKMGDAFAEIEACDAESMERIFSLDFLEHLEPQRAVDFVRGAHRVLVPGGFLLCRTPSADGPFGSHDRHNDLTHRWAMTSSSAFTFMRLAGFRDENISVHQEAPVAYKLSNLARLALFRATTAFLGLLLDVVGIGGPKVWTRSMWVIARK